MQNILVKRFEGLDFLKVIAALFITNSHFQPLYEDVNVGFATLGVHGNALFFFVAGYLLMMGFERHNLNFTNWYKARIRRLWPSVFIWAILSAALWGRELTIGKLVWAEGYWFLQSIAINYILFYLLLKFLPCKVFSLFMGGGKNSIQIIVFIISILFSVVYFFFMPMATGSPFHTDFHYVCHFSVMVMGAMVYSNRNRICCQSFKMDLIYLIFFFALYFGILAIGKGRVDSWYYMQILALIPLHFFIYYAYKVTSYQWTLSLFNMRCIGSILTFIASLTLEIYVVQFMIITNRFNALFPLNTVIVFTLICIGAYGLKVLTSLFLSIMSKESLQWRNLFSIS